MPIDEGGVFLETTPLVHSKLESESEMEALQEVLEEANQQNSKLTDQLADTVQKLEEKAETARLKSLLVCPQNPLVSWRPRIES